MESYVVTIGNPGIDHYYRCENWPVLGDKARVHFLESVVGGMIPNAGCILATYGAQTHLLSQLGDDHFLRQIVEDLEQFGLGLDHVTVEQSMGNNQNFIMLSENEKTIFLVQGDKPPFRLNHKQQHLLDHAGYVYTTIADLKRIEDHSTLLERLVRNGVRIFLDVESEAFDSAASDRVFFEAASFISFNETAFDKFLRSNGGNELWQRLRREKETVISITRGKDGCTLIERGEEFSMKGLEVNPVDTTGAGDTFNASLLYGHMQGWDLPKAARFATAAAARSILFMGPKAGAVPIDEVLQFMNRGDLA